MSVPQRPSRQHLVVPPRRGNLPVVIYQFALSPYDNWVNLAWGGALLIGLMVLGINVGARIMFRDKNKR